jgi:hypothetical protein
VATLGLGLRVLSGPQQETNVFGLQSIANHAHRILVQPVQVGLLAQPWRRTRTWSLLREHFLHYGTFYTTLVKKSQQANRASELRRVSLPRTRVN